MSSTVNKTRIKNWKALTVIYSHSGTMRECARYPETIEALTGL